MHFHGHTLLKIVFAFASVTINVHDCMIHLCVATRTTVDYRASGVGGVRCIMAESALV